MTGMLMQTAVTMALIMALLGAIAAMLMAHWPQLIAALRYDGRAAVRPRAAVAVRPVRVDAMMLAVVGPRATPLLRLAA